MIAPVDLPATKPGSRKELTQAVPAPENLILFDDIRDLGNGNRLDGHLLLHHASTGIEFLLGTGGGESYLDADWGNTSPLARPPAQPEDYHGHKPSTREVREIFPLETMRSISNDWVIRHAGQLAPSWTRASDTTDRPRARRWSVSTTDGRVEVSYRDERIGFRELPEPVRTTHKPMPPQGNRITEKSQTRPSLALGLSEHADGLGLRRYRPRPLFCALPLRPNCSATLQNAEQRNDITQKRDTSNRYAKV